MDQKKVASASKMVGGQEGQAEATSSSSHPSSPSSPRITIAQQDKATSFPTADFAESSKAAQQRYAEEQQAAAATSSQGSPQHPFPTLPPATSTSPSPAARETGPSEKRSSVRFNFQDDDDNHNKEAAHSSTSVVDESGPIAPLPSLSLADRSRSPGKLRRYQTYTATSPFQQSKERLGTPTSASSSSSQRSRPSSPTFSTTQASGGSHQAGTFSPSSSSIQARARLSSILHPGDYNNRGTQTAGLTSPNSKDRFADSFGAFESGAMAAAAAIGGTFSTTMSSSRRAAGPVPGPSTSKRAAQEDSRKKANGHASTGSSARPSSKERERERERAAARQAEKDNWERTRGAGAAVLSLLDDPQYAPDQRQWAAEDVLPTLEDIEGKRFEPIESPSPDPLLSRGIADYTLLPKVLGRGKFSTVFLASKNGELSAVKHTALFPHHQLISTRLLREPTLLAELPPHPNLVEVKETIRTRDHFYLVEEYLGGYVTLEALVPKLGHKRGDQMVLPLAIADDILAQLLSAVRAIHHPLQICHRDIKPENILIHEDSLNLKLLDFGLATHYSKSEPKLTTCCGSPAFHCPEIVKALASPPGSVSYWGPEVDAWTCAVTMLRVITGVKYPLGSNHSSLRSMAIRAQRAVALIPLSDEPGRDETLGRSIRDKIAKLLEMDSVKRIRYFEEMSHEQDRVAEPDRTQRNFKSTTFIPSQPSHTMDLKLLSASSTQKLTASSLQLTSTATTSSGSSSGGGFPFGNVTGASSTPGTSRQGTPVSSRPASPSGLGGGGSGSGSSGIERDGNRSSSSLTTPPPRLIMINPSMQPAQRVLSYIKYCLRCAGILYHTWPDSRTSALRSWSEVLGGATPHFPDGPPLSPTTPLFPGAGHRSDDWNHVQIFQCVIEYREPEEPAEEGIVSTGLGLVQSIMAAFGRKPQAAKRAYSQPSISPARGTSRTPTGPGTPRGHPAAPAAVNGSAAGSKNGPPRYLAFYMTVRFPKVSRNYSRPAYSRTVTWNSGRRSRASSSATPASGPSSGDEGRSKEPTPIMPSTPTLLSLSHQQPAPLTDLAGTPTPTKTRPMPKSGSAENMPPPSPSNALGPNHGLAINTHPELLRTMSSATVTGSRSATPSRSRKASRAHKMSKARIFIDVSDEAALESVRQALSIAGTTDGSDSEDANSSARGMVADASSLTEAAEPGTPTLRDSRSRTNLRSSGSASSSRTRDGRSLSYQGPRAGRSAGPFSTTGMKHVLSSIDASNSSPESGERKGSHERSRSRGSTSTARAGRSAGPLTTVASASKALNVAVIAQKERIPTEMTAQDFDEQESRGRNMTRTKLGSSVSTVSSPPSTSEVGPSAVPAPSMLSAVPLKEESPSSDNLAQLAEDLKIAVAALCGPEAKLDISAAPISPDSSSLDLTAQRQQVRTLLQAIHRRLSPSSAVPREQLRETLSPILFSLFSALSPALGLQPTESLGLPEVASHIERQSTLQGLAKESLSIVANTASPRELFMATQERLEVLARESEEGQGEDSNPSSADFGQRGLDETAADREGQDSSSTTAEWLGALEAAGLIDILAIATTRLETKKPANFIDPLAKLLPRAIKTLANQVTIPPTEVDTAISDQPAPRHRAAVEVMQSICDWAQAAKVWLDGLDASTEAVIGIVLATFAAISASLPLSTGEQAGSSLAEDYFLRQHPHYRLPSAVERSDVTRGRSGSTSRVADVWTSLKKTAAELNMDLLQVAFSREVLPQADSTTSRGAAVQLGAFLLYVQSRAHTSRQQEQSQRWSEDEAKDLLSQSIPLIMASLGTSPPTTNSSGLASSEGGLDSRSQLADCALLWLLWLLDDLSASAKQRQELAEESLLPLIQVLSTHAALSSVPSHRHISLWLLSTVLRSHTAEPLLTDIMRDLLVETPFPPLRCAAVGILKDWLVGTKRQEGQGITVQDLVQGLQDVLFTLPQPLPDFEGDGTIDQIKTYFEEQGPWLTECCHLLYVLWSSSSDQANRESVNKDLIRPLDELVKKSVDVIQTKGDGGEQEDKQRLQMQITLVEMSLQRVRDVSS